VTHRPARIVPLALALAGAATLAGCLKVDKDADAAARGFNDEVRNGTPLTGDTHVGPQLNGPDAAPMLAKFRAAIPTSAPTSAKNTGFSSNTDNTGTTLSLTYELDFPGGRVVTVTDALQKPSGQTAWTIVGFKGEPSGPSSEISAGSLPPASSGNSTAD
jgi:hypothetical protein